MRGGFLNTPFKIPIIFCHWLSEKYKKQKERWGTIHVVSDNSNLLQWVWLCHITLYHEHNDRERRQNDA